MVQDAVAQGPLGGMGKSDPRDPYGALRQAVTREGINAGSGMPELRSALRECAALARHRMQPPERYLVEIKTCVREAVGAIDASQIESLMARVVTLSIAEYYRTD